MANCSVSCWLETGRSKSIIDIGIVLCKAIQLVASALRLLASARRRPMRSVYYAMYEGSTANIIGLSPDYSTYNLEADYQSGK